jgi:hypothetical protein
MKKSIIIILILVSLLFTVLHSLGHAADYISSTFPPDQVLKEMILINNEWGASTPDQIIVAGKIKHPTEKGAYIVYARFVNGDTDVAEIIIRKTDRNYWFYVLTFPGYESIKGVLQTAY